MQHRWLSFICRFSGVGLLSSLGLLSSVQCIPPAVSAVPEVKIVGVTQSSSFEKVGDTEYIWLVRNVDRVTFYSDGSQTPEKQQELLLCQSSDGTMGKCSPVHITCGNPGVQCHERAPHASERTTPKASKPRPASKRTGTAKAQPPNEEDAVYWQTKCNNLVVTNESVGGFAEKKKLMGVCLKRCKRGSSLRLMSCLREANTEEDYEKCGELL